MAKISLHYIPVIVLENRCSNVNSISLISDSSSHDSKPHTRINLTAEVFF